MAWLKSFAFIDKSAVGSVLEPVVFRVAAKRGKDIAPYSAYKSEREVVLLPCRQIRVLATQTLTSPIYHRPYLQVDAEEVEFDDEQHKPRPKRSLRLLRPGPWHFRVHYCCPCVLMLYFWVFMAFLTFLYGFNRFGNQPIVNSTGRVTCTKTDVDFYEDFDGVWRWRVDTFDC